MIQLIIGEKGKGKTKILLDKANQAIKEANGNIVYLDKSKQHMYELNNRIRLIDVTNFPISNCDVLIGFLCGLISRDNDLEQIFLDSFLKISRLEGEDINPMLDKIDKLSETYHVDFIISISTTREFLSAAHQEQVIFE
ncbi:MAG: twitching motility protein PilT [Solobacterium sp.]|nr:twitching motility protein PilT [Solobacterium sp.]